MRCMSNELILCQDDEEDCVDGRMRFAVDAMLESMDEREPVIPTPIKKGFAR